MGKDDGPLVIRDSHPAQMLLRKQLEAFGLGQLLPPDLAPGPLTHRRHLEVRRRLGARRWRAGAGR
jgi:hypothetical protein